MTLEMAGLFWIAVGGYMGAGLLIGILFLWIGAGRLDHAARGSSIFFKILTLPGAALLWPYILLRWASGRVINAPLEHGDSA